MKQLWSRLRNLDTVASLRRQLASLSARIDLMRRNQEHTTYRCHVLERRNRELLKMVTTQAQTIEELRAQQAGMEERLRRAALRRLQERRALRLWMTRAGERGVSEY